MKTILISFISCLVLVHSSWGVESNKRIEERKINVTKWAFIIGIDEYADENLEPLPNASRFGKDIAKILKQTYGYRDEHVTELYNQNATEGAIFRQLSQFVDVVGYDDTFFAYFLVHDMVSAGGRYYLVPHNGNVNQEWTLISVDRIKQFFLDLRARPMFIVVGSCSQLPPVYEEDFRRLEYNSDAFHMLLYRCPEMEDEANAMQIFNENFTAVMKGERNIVGGKGEISVMRLFDYLQKKLYADGINLLKFSNFYGRNFVFAPQLDERMTILSEQLNKGNSNQVRINAISEIVELIQVSGEEKRGMFIPRFPDNILEISQDSQDNVNVRRRAMEALGQLKYHDAIHGLINVFANSSEFSLQSTALDALIKINTEEVLPFLRETLHHQEPAFRISATRALIRFNDRNSLPDLLDLLQHDEHVDVRIAILELIDRFKPLMIDERNIVMRSLNDPAAPVRKEAVNALSKLGESRAIPEMLRLLDADDEPIVRQIAAYAVVRLVDDSNHSWITRGLVNALKKDDVSSVREAAAFSLGELGGEEAEKTLIDVVKDRKEDARVVRTAAKALGDLRSTKAVHNLIKLLERDDPEIRRAAAQSLGKIGDERAITPLEISLKKEEVRFVVIAISKALEEINTQRNNIQYWREKLNDTNPQVRIQAITKLVELKDPEIVRLLINKLTDSEYSVRYKIIKVLSNYRDDASIEAVMSALTDDNYLKRQGAINILGNIGLNEFTDVLLRHLEDPSTDVRAEVYKALGRMEDDRLAKIFLTGFKDRDIIVCEAAAEGLASYVISLFSMGRHEQAFNLATDAFMLSGKALGQVHQWTRWYNVLAVVNHESPFDLEFRLNRLFEPEATIEPQDVDVLVVNNGDEFECVLENRSRKELYFAILDLSSDGNISQIHPVEGASEIIAPESKWSGENEAFIPEGIDHIKDVIKVFVMTEPFNSDVAFKSPDRRREKYQKLFVRKDIFSQLLAGVGQKRIEIDPQIWMTAQKVMIVKQVE